MRWLASTHRVAYVLALCASIGLLIPACYLLEDAWQDGPGGVVREPRESPTPTPVPVGGEARGAGAGETETGPGQAGTTSGPEAFDRPAEVQQPFGTPESEAISEWIRGMSLSPRWEKFFAYSAFRESVDRIAATNANYITLIVHYEQETLSSTEFRPTWLAPEEWVLVEGIEYIHNKCMGVMLKPHIDIATGEWQAHIDPSDRAEWFRNYGEIILRYARIAEEHNVEMLAVGTELNSMAGVRWHPDNTRYWRELIHDVRQVYSGKLTYSGQWGPGRWTVEDIEWLDELDYIGIAAYFDLPTETIAIEEIKQAWDHWNEELLRDVHEKFDLPLIFTEVGYRNEVDTRFRPWASQRNEHDELEQANLYEGLMAYWSEIDYFKGMFWWEWRDDLSPDNRYYTPNDKLAEQVLTEWFGKGVPSIVPASSRSCFAPGSYGDGPGMPVAHQP